MPPAYELWDRDQLLKECYIIIVVKYTHPKVCHPIGLRADWVSPHETPRGSRLNVVQWRGID